MRFRHLSCTAALLFACALSTASRAQSAPPSEAVSRLLDAFRDICLNTAPSFDEAAQAARRNGITQLEDAGSMQLGMRADNELGVQVKPNQECVVTSPEQPDPALTTRFLSQVRSHSSTPVGDRVPSPVRIKGQPFIVTHDRQGGEALVLLKAVR